MKLYILVAFLWICVLLLYCQVLYLIRTLNALQSRQSLFETNMKKIYDRRTREHGNGTD